MTTNADRRDITTFKVDDMTTFEADPPGLSGKSADSANSAARAHDLVSGTDIVLTTDVVVIGLGYVGLPLVRGASGAGLTVAGLDLSTRIVDGLNAGRSHVDDISDDDVARLVSTGFRATTDEAVLDDAGTAIICVPTPLNNDGTPDLTAVLSAGRMVARHIHPGMLVVLESTTYPGTTDEVLRPILEESGLRAGVDFSLAFSPERIDPGNAKYGLSNTPKVVGGFSPSCTERAAKLYGLFVDTVVEARGTREAEMSKLLENTYRQVNIALVNEIATFSRQLGVDIWDTIRCASTKPFGFQAFYPGPGVGGHCIPIDPSYLSYRVRQLGFPFRFAELAQEINDGMPRFVARRVQDLLNREQRAINGSHVLLLGVTYKADISDERESPAEDVARALLEMGAHVTYADPYVEEWIVDGRSIPRVTAVREAMQEAHVTVLLQRHAAYDIGMLQQAKLLFDTRGVVPGSERL
ncbi:MAG: wbpA [Frankiales bacterium]|nr:wbpA [Frankiales bacterium]